MRLSGGEEKLNLLTFNGFPPDNRVRDAGVAGSNPATPTIHLCHSFFRLFLIAGGSRVNRGFPVKTAHRAAFPRCMAVAGSFPMQFLVALIVAFLIVLPAS